MKPILTALLAGLLVASARAQSALDRKPGTGDPHFGGFGNSENMFEQRAREAKERQKAAVKAAAEAANKAEADRIAKTGERRMIGTVDSVADQGLLVRCAEPAVPPRARPIPTGDSMSRIGLGSGNPVREAAPGPKPEPPRATGAVILKDHPNAKGLAIGDKINLVVYEVGVIPRYTEKGAVYDFPTRVYSVTPAQK